MLAYRFSNSSPGRKIIHIRPRQTFTSYLLWTAPNHGINVRNATLYPLRVIVICGAGVTPVAIGPLATLVSLSITSRLPLENVPRPETSTCTLRDAPGPLLSVAAF